LEFNSIHNNPKLCIVCMLPARMREKMKDGKRERKREGRIGEEGREANHGEKKEE
jgi:hypothetical protein